MKRHAAISKERWSEVQGRLDAIERMERCRILFAVESGSRAWGFPSPDSDYDVRFVYARPASWYLSIHPRRDVVETPIEHDMDVNGWDVRKALHLVLKSNAVISEWMESPIVYRRDAAVLRRLRGFADRALHPRALAYHYLHLARRQVAAKFTRDRVPLKPYFYALRPALALRFLRLHAGRRPPMQLQALLAARIYRRRPPGPSRPWSRPRAARGRWAAARESRRWTAWLRARLPRPPREWAKRRSADPPNWPPSAGCSGTSSGTGTADCGPARDMIVLARRCPRPV